MNIFVNFAQYCEPVLEACEKRVQEYPPLLKDMAYKYLKKLRILEDNAEKRRCMVNYHIPFWLKDTYSLSSEACSHIALGNIFGLLYFLSQDQVMDGGPGDSNVNTLLMSSKFYFDFISQYQKLFSPHSPFWNYFDMYMNEWSYSIIWERAEHWGIAKAYTENDLILLSRKAAPLKIPFAAACLLAGQEQSIQAFSDMVDYDQAVYQLYDDWRDWSEDLSAGNYTYLLVQVMDYFSITDPTQLKADHVKKAVLEGKVLDKVFATSRKLNHMAMNSISDIDSSYLKGYIKMQEEQCIDYPLKNCWAANFNSKKHNLGAMLLYFSNRNKED